MGTAVITAEFLSSAIFVSSSVVVGGLRLYLKVLFYTDHFSFSALGKHIHVYALNLLLRTTEALIKCVKVFVRKRSGNVVVEEGNEGKGGEYEGG